MCNDVQDRARGKLLLLFKILYVLCTGYLLSSIILKLLAHGPDMNCNLNRLFDFMNVTSTMRGTYG